MSLLAFKESLVTPLKKSIEQQRLAPLSQFRSRDDLTRQWDTSIGLEIALNHIESTYAALNQASADLAHNVEIIPPQN
jgi:hypothetical protein